jgi:putative heme-binding domain-containing protein
MEIRISFVFGLFAVLLTAVASAASKDAIRPNVLFVLCDDLGPGDIGVLWQNGRKGKQKFATPNMDQFAKEGMILSRHYCPAPSCMASRSSLMTGRHQGHCARRNFQFDAELPNVHTLGTVMEHAGYATAAIGKWGMAGGPYQLSIKSVRGDRSPMTNPSHPTLRGFDYFYGYTAHRDAHYHYPKLGNRPLYDGFVDVTDRLAKCYSTDLLTARTKKWIVDHHRTKPNQPFFTYLCYTAPHAGLRIPTTSHLTARGNYPRGGGLNGGVQWLDDAAHGQINTAQGEIDKIDEHGGTAGPDLSKPATPERKLDRLHFLESIVLPNAKIAKGFGTVAIVLDSGKVVAGKIKAEDEETLTLVTPENRTIRIDRDNVDEQTAATSAMPEMTMNLTVREIRDLVEYLATLGKNDQP